MNLREQCLKAFSSGYAVATFAKRIGRDSSTLYKWLDGTRKISPEVEDDIKRGMKEVQETWNECEFDE